MDTKFVEAGHGPNAAGNWGKFAVCRFTIVELAEDIQYPGCEGDRRGLVMSNGWTPQHIWVLDLATGEGAYFMLGGLAAADLNKHRIWVCPLFEPFLTWLYAWYTAKGGDWWEDLPRTVDLPDAPFAIYGYRRPGPDETAS